MQTKRWTTYPFPPYSYVTGKSPHPLREADGHGCPGPPEISVAPTNETWQQCELYLWGVDLFNAGFYWESHEAWEGVWHAAERKGPVADLQKALIKLAAAGVKAREGRVEGVRRHATRSLELGRIVAESTDTTEFMGVNLDELSQLGEQTLATADEIVSAAAKVDAIVLPKLQLKPHSG